MSYIGNEPIVSATRTVTEVSATAGQTVFTANGGYTVGFIDVFVNGSKLTNSDFTATNGTTITLNEAAQASDIVRLEALGTFLTSSALTANNPAYTGTLTGGTGVVNIGSGQLYKDGSGNVGIGTSSPSGRLQVTSPAGASFLIGFNNTSVNYLDANTNIFRTGSFVETMRIDSSGNLLVGSTGGASGRCNIFNPNSGDSRPLFLTNTSSSATPNGSIFIDNANSGTSAWNFLQCFSNTSTSQRAFIRGDGTFGSATSTYGGTSDARIKTDIVDTSPKLEKLMQVRVVNYTRIDDASQNRELGVIAQELEQVFPGLVYESEIKDADGNILCPDRKNVKYSVFIPMLIKAIQEQQAMITELKQRIEILESK